MIDTLVHELPRARELGMPARLGLEAGNYGLLTLHRPSNVDDPATLRALIQLLAELSRDLPLAFPVHPRTRGRIEGAGLIEPLRSSRIVLTDPLGYRENLALMASARVVLTDSGGMQEETTALGVPCLTLRANTERPVTVEQGTSTLVGVDPELIRATFLDVLDGRYKRPEPIPFWDGRAGERAADVLRSAWGLAENRGARPSSLSYESFKTTPILPRTQAAFPIGALP
jgi:UDP-N-acetylglucosamine 2-epimerase (non-hydrolysing)